MGKLALIGIFGILAVGTVGAKTSNPYIEGLSLGLAAIVVFGCGGAMLWYSHKHPQEATLEGMEVVVMEQQKAWAAKTVDLSGATPLIPNPGGTPPQLNPPEVVEE